MAAVEEDTTIVVDLPRLLEVDMVVDLIRIVLHLDILLLGVGTILLRQDETMPTRRVAAMIMFRRGSRVRDTMMIVLGGDRLQTLEGEERTMEGVIGEHPFFCASNSLTLADEENFHLLSVVGRDGRTVSLIAKGLCSIGISIVCLQLCFSVL